MQRISFLQNDLKQQFKDDSRIRQLRVVQAVELQEALDNFATVNDVYQVWNFLSIITD